MWNEKFSKEGFMYGTLCNVFIKDNIHIVPKNGSVLCLAEGEGRNAIYLAKEAYEVEALDASEIGLAKLAKRINDENLENISLNLCDLNDWEPQQSYDAIVASFMHLPEPLRSQTFEKAMDALKPQGHIIMEFFSQDQMREGYSSGGPKDLDLLYDVNDLFPIFTRKDITIMQLSQEEDTLDEGLGHQGKASLIRVIVKKS